jgi:SPP1 family predicted phage head-tail adaptor
MITPAGKLRTKITIQQRDTTKETDGQPVNTWATFGEVYARVVSAGGAETFKGQQFDPEVTHKVTVRFLSGIKPMMRIVTPDQKILDIKYVNEGERRLDDIVLVCVERIGESGDLDVG